MVSLCQSVKLRGTKLFDRIVQIRTADFTLAMWVRLKLDLKHSRIMYICRTVVYNHWTGLVDWTSGLTSNIIFMPSNETHLPIGCMMHHINPKQLFLAQ